MKDDRYSRTPGLVLRSVQYKEASRILTVLTAEHGKITVTANSAVRKNSKVASVVQQFAYSDMLLSVSKGMYYLTEGAVIEQFSGLSGELSSVALASYLAQLTESIADEDSVTTDPLRIMLNALFALSENLYPQAVIKSATELRLIAAAGFMPETSCCVRCGTVEVTAFSPELGGCLCGSCAVRTADASALSQTALAAIRHVTSCGLKKLYSFSPDAAEELAELAENYVLTKCERSFATLDYYKSL
ncbi:MAG: DNA repair protein RecO [Oscillospiraceae bacterium]|jgi:DNA repair protein RecO (recombination protein O)|nr:DNA repair protein RecO [Oscillospiraceae bacterium]